MCPGRRPRPVRRPFPRSQSPIHSPDGGVQRVQRETGKCRERVKDFHDSRELVRGKFLVSISIPRRSRSRARLAWTRRDKNFSSKQATNGIKYQRLRIHGRSDSCESTARSSMSVIAPLRRDRADFFVTHRVCAGAPSCTIADSS
ncbi:hypothetical protein EVAR_58918_1 [Eumeta japonica]|uniref:Uncharacterized protein n=1 Tax=Eumeta variegata TaxID=151549 RepID=A0A4C1YAE2_EUMVA|nr:hypothetical protein EVAR_58918_1 [Eumeta japonica]